MVLAAPGVHGGSFNSTSTSLVARAQRSPPEWHQRGASRRRWRSALVAWAAFLFTSPLLLHTRQRPSEMGEIPNRVGGDAGERGLWRRRLGMAERLRRPRVLLLEG
jgi:hypothetical protein